MPVISGVGQSSYTATKQQHFRKLLDWHVGVTERVIANHPSRFRQSYLYIDACAGSGILADGSSGSPLIAAERLTRASVAFDAVLVETDLSAFAELDRNVTGLSPSIEARLTTYQALIDDIAVGSPDALQLGLLYIDPNGTPDFDALRRFAKARPRMEILISVTATGCKRGGKLDAPLEEWLQKIGKRFWLIRKPYTQWQWTFLFGSDYASFGKRYPGIEAEPTTSQLGQKWLEDASYTVKERQGKVQPPLTGLMPSIFDIQPSGQSVPRLSGERAASASVAEHGQ